MDGTGKEQLCGKINDLPMIDPGMHMLGGEKRIVFGPERFWPTHVMRCFTLKPGGKAASTIRGFTGLYALQGKGNSRLGMTYMILGPDTGFMCRRRFPIRSGTHQKQRT